MFTKTDIEKYFNAEKAESLDCLCNWGGRNYCCHCFLLFPENKFLQRCCHSIIADWFITGCGWL